MKSESEMTYEEFYELYGKSIEQAWKNICQCVASYLDVTNQWWQKYRLDCIKVYGRVIMPDGAKQIRFCKSDKWFRRRNKWMFK